MGEADGWDRSVQPEMVGAGTVVVAPLPFPHLHVRALPEALHGEARLELGEC